MSAGHITVYPDTAESYDIQLTEGANLLIGRKPDAEGRPKIVLPVPEVSGQHAELRHTPDGWTIRDSGSTNGTRLNGERLTAGKEYLLRSGDRIKIAQIELLISLPHGQQARPSETADEDKAEKTHLRIQLINATILVGDIKGFTSLMESHAHSPEVVMQAAQRVFDALHQEIRNNQGQIEKIMGDAIMAYWHSDDSASSQGDCAYRACHTALRLRSLVTALSLNPDFWPFQDHPLQVDMALASGPVAAGALGHQEANPALLGDTANLAFRIEKLIGEDTPSDIVVDGSTYLMVRDHFRFVELGETSVKGRRRGVEVHCLIGRQGLPVA